MNWIKISLTGVVLKLYGLFFFQEFVKQMTANEVTH